MICLEELQDDATLPRFTWGIHDAGLYRRALEHLATQPQPFGATIMTLSSHQPYAFGAFPPGAEGREADYRGALHYADGALGAFYDALREQPWWPRTLLVVTADNGTSFSGETETVRVSASEEATRIPLLLIAGDGSLTPRRTDRIASQVDILPTLARLLGLQRRNAWWGRSLLDERGPRRAFHSSPWGAGMITSWEGRPGRPTWWRTGRSSTRP